MVLDLRIIKMNIFFYCVGAFLFLNSQPVIAGDYADPVKSNSVCKLTLGLSDWMPYQQLKPGGKATGKQIALVQQIASLAGCELSYKSISFPEGLKAIKNGGIDLQLNATPSSERENYAYFSQPYRTEFLLLYSTEKYLQKCQKMSLEELLSDGFKLAVQNGLVYGPELSKIQNTPELNQKIIYVDNNVQHVDLVNDNRLDGIVDDPLVVSYRSTLYATGSTLSSCSIVVSSSPISIIFSKKTVPARLVERFNQAISEIKQTDEYQRNWSW